MNRVLPARAARIAAGLTLQQAAKKLRRHPRYLQECERKGFPAVLAERAAVLYRCPLDLLALPPCFSAGKLHLLATTGSEKPGNGKPGGGSCTRPRARRTA